MIKNPLNGLAAAGRALHRNILRPTARPTQPRATGAAAYYQDQRSPTQTSLGSKLATKLGALFKPTQAARPPMRQEMNGGPRYGGAYYAAPFAAQQAANRPQFGTFASPTRVVTQQQLPQLREETLGLARGMVFSPAPGAAPASPGRIGLFSPPPDAAPKGPATPPPRENLAERMKLSRNYQAAAQQPGGRGPAGVNGGTPAGQARAARLPGGRRPLAADRAPPVVNARVAAPNQPAARVNAAPLGPGAPLAPRVNVPAAPLAPAVQPLARMNAAAAPGAQPATPPRVRWPSNERRVRFSDSPVAPRVQASPVAQAGVAGAVSGPRARSSQIVVTTAAKSKLGVGAKRLRSLLIAQDGTSIYYDKSHVQGAFGRFHRATLADGTPRGIKQFRLPENAAQRMGRRKTKPRQNMKHTTPFASVQKEAAQMRELGMQVFGIHRTSQGKAFIETELFAGSIAEKMPLMSSGARSAIARHSLQSMLEQLAPLHAKGSVHRDIKNDNLLFNAEGRVQIGDPGLLITAQEIKAYNQRGAVGTPCYMPPENFDARLVKTPAASADTWSAGCAYIQQLTRSWPLRGVPQDGLGRALQEFEEVRQAYLNLPPQPRLKQGQLLPLPQTSRPWAKCITEAHQRDPEGTAFVLRHLLARDPRQRMGSASASTALENTPHKGRKVPRGVLADVATHGLAATLNQPGRARG